jgi:AcrR family transcriptional regulator
MARKRLTREDSRELTLQRLVDAAQKLIAKKGFAASSVEDIAESAGYSRGAFYSNFASKDDLFIELLRRDHQAGMEEFKALMSDEVPLETIHARARDLYSCIFRDHEQFLYWTEARMRSIRDARFRTKLNALVAEKRAEVTGFITYFFKRAGATPAIPPEQMATGFMSLVEGMTLFTLSSPMDVTPEMVQAILAHFVDAIFLQQARQGGTPAPR